MDAAAAAASSGKCSSSTKDDLQRKLQALVEEHGVQAVEETLGVVVSVNNGNNNSQQQQQEQQQQQQQAATLSALLLTAGIMDGSFDAILVTDHEGRLQLVNSAARSLFGLSSVTASSLNSISISSLLFARPGGSSKANDRNEGEGGDWLRSLHQKGVSAAAAAAATSAQGAESSSSLCETIHMATPRSKNTASSRRRRQQSQSQSQPQQKPAYHVLQGRRYDDDRRRRIIPCLQVRLEFLPERDCFVVICHDRTPFMKQQVKLAHKRVLLGQEHQLADALLLERSNDTAAIIICHPVQGIIQRVNRKFLLLFEYLTPDPIIHSSCHVAELFDTKNTQQEEFMQQLQSPTSWASHTRQARRSNGTLFSCLVQVQRARATKTTAGSEWLVIYLMEKEEEKEKEKEKEELQQQQAPLLSTTAIITPTTVVSNNNNNNNNRIRPSPSSSSLFQEFSNQFLVHDPTHTAEFYSNATILFAGIAGFAHMSQSLTPVQAVSLLSSVFARFDQLVFEYGRNKNVHRVKTVGDCYIVAALHNDDDPGATDDDDDDDDDDEVANDQEEKKNLGGCVNVCQLAVRMINALPDTLLDLRIGIHTGPVLAGIIQHRSSNNNDDGDGASGDSGSGGGGGWMYDLWGEAVNLASHMESYGVPGNVQVTRAVVDCLSEKLDRDMDFVVEKRDEMIDIKGDGLLETYFLLDTSFGLSSSSPTNNNHNNTNNEDHDEDEDGHLVGVGRGSITGGSTMSEYSEVSLPTMEG